MKHYIQFLIIASCFLIRNASGAVLDISGWTQEGAGGANQKVKITGVASGELPFFTGTPGSVTARKIITTDISDSSAIGRQLLSAVDQAAVQAIVGSTPSASPLSNTYVGYGSGSNTVTGESVFTYNASQDRLYVESIQFGTSRLGYSSADVFSFIGGTGGESLRLGLNGGNTAIFSSPSGINNINFDSISVTVPFEIYDSDGWNGDLTVPTKDAIRDKIESMSVLPTIDTETLLGRYSSGTGATEVIAIGEDFSVSGGELSLASDYLEYSATIEDLQDGAMSSTVTFDAGIILNGPSVAPLPVLVDTDVDGQMDMDLTEYGGTHSATSNATLEFVGTPITGQIYLLNIAADATQRTTTIPSAFSVNAGATITSVVTPANTNTYLTFRRESARWVVFGDPAAVTGTGNYVLANTPTFASESAPTVDAVGEIAVDNNLWAASRGAILHHDGTAATALIGVLTSDIPSDGQVPTWNTGGTITWESGVGGGSGDVTAASAFAADNLLIRSDGAGKGVQASGISIDDSDNMTGVASIAATTVEVGSFIWEGTTADDFETSLLVTDPTADRFATLPDADGHVMLSEGGPIGSTRIPFGTANDNLTSDSVLTYNSGTDTLAVPNLTLSTGGALGAATATTPSAGDDDTSVATTAFVQDEVDGTSTGSWAAPYTTASTLSPTWSGPFHAVYMGVAQTVALPDAAAYAGRGILVYNTGAFIVTIDPDADDFVVRDGSAQSDGVNFTLSSGAGNYVSLVSDGANWITLGYKGTLSVGS